MKTLDLLDASKSLFTYVEELDDEPLILTVDGKPVAALVFLKNMDRESLALSTSPDFLRLMQAARDEIERGDSLTLEELKREFPR